jgi:hypothetical protein
MPLLKRTVVQVDIAGHSYKLAALTMREMERLAKEEKEAVDAKDWSALSLVRCKTVALSLSNAGEQVTADQVAEELSNVMLNSLYLAIMEANGLKLSTKVGEVEASQSS